MKTTTSLTFSKDGLLNPQAVNFFLSNQMESLVAFTDGTEEAYDHLRQFDFSQLITSADNLAVAKLPLWDLRVLNMDGKLSNPSYVYTDQNRVDWFCENICVPLMTIHVSDMTSPGGTKVQLNREQVALFSQMAFSFWNILKTAEDHLGFPAMAIDALTRWSRNLDPQMIDIPALRQETGLESLDYNRLTDTLSVTVAKEEFTVKMSVLDSLLKEHILPFFNRNRGRRYRLEVVILGITQPVNVPKTLSYGELGQIIDQMQSLVHKTMITATTPISAEDLLQYSKKVKINDESCLFAQGNQTIDQFLASVQSDIVRYTDLSAVRSITNTPNHEPARTLEHC